MTLSYILTETPDRICSAVIGTFTPLIERQRQWEKPNLNSQHITTTRIIDIRANNT